MTTILGRKNLPEQLSSLNHDAKRTLEQTSSRPTTTTTTTNMMMTMDTRTSKQGQQLDGVSRPNSETLERGRRRKFRYFVASLGLTVAAVNCYAQATFCIAIVEMVLPADYVFRGESGSQAIKVVLASQALDGRDNVANNSRPSLGSPANSNHNHNHNHNNHNLSYRYARHDESMVAPQIEELENLSCPVEYKYRDYYDEWRFPTNGSHSRARQLEPMAAGPNAQVIDISNRFDWDASRQGLLLGAFAMGMAPLQILGGRMAEIYGAKWVLLAGCVGTALTNLTIPVLAHFSYTLLVINRLVMGVAQAGMEPGLMCLMAQWLAPAETGFFISMLLFALCIGFFLGSLLSSFLLTTGLGWPLTYYVTGGLNLLVSILWLVYASKGPERSKLISAEELAYIKHEQQQERLRAGLEEAKRGRSPSSSVVISDLVAPNCGAPVRAKSDPSSPGEQESHAPWLNILTTPSVWAFIICKISVRWCADVLTIELPTYLANVLHLSIKLNGILNSLSSAFFAIFSFITGYFVNELLKRTYEGAENELERTGHSTGKALMGKTTLRKLFQSVASFGSALSIFLMTRYDCNIQLSMSMMFVMSACLMMGTGGELQIPYDMTSRYPGTLHGMACTLSVSGWLAPPLIGLILGDQPSSRHRWSIVWYLTASINFIGGLVFVLFADASPRNFDKEAPSKKVAPCRLMQDRRCNYQRQNGNSGLLGGPNNGQPRCQGQPEPQGSGSSSSRRRRRRRREEFGAARQVSGRDTGSRPHSRPVWWPAAPRPSQAAASTCSFDDGELLRIRQLEGSQSSGCSRLDSMIVRRPTDLMFPYQHQEESSGSGAGEQALRKGLSAPRGLLTRLSAAIGRRDKPVPAGSPPRKQVNGQLLREEPQPPQPPQPQQPGATVAFAEATRSSSRSKIITRL